MPVLDHPILTASIALIRQELAARGASDPELAARLQALSPLERDVLERCIHSSGDPSLVDGLRFGPALAACRQGLAALEAGAPILCDTAMAAAAVAPMARRTRGNRVLCLLDWAPATAPLGSTRSAAAVEPAWSALTLGLTAALTDRSGMAPVVLIGSAPTALERLLDLVAAGAPAPSLLIGMPVGFVGVAESKRRLAASGLAQVRLDGSRGGAGLVAAACNALLRATQAATTDAATATATGTGESEG
jgi:precorrin-8X/cobalt-precorrin-8 methylmutase